MAIPFDTAKHALGVLIAAYADDNGVTASQHVEAYCKALLELNDKTAPATFVTYVAICRYRDLVELPPEEQAKLDDLQDRWHGN
jgi:hypothetical protein